MSNELGKGARLRVGTSGYQYDHWRGVLYPEGEPKRQWFARYCEAFDTVEINNTFYQLPKAETFDQWHEQAPRGFRFALKYSQYGTHMKRLKDPADHVEKFMDRAARLGNTLGPILVQLPARLKPQADRLHRFLAQTPADQRFALEVRNPQWLRQDVYDVLRDHGVALCLHDLIEDHPRVITADWVYLRYHAAQHNGNYPHQALVASARRIRGYLDDGLDVYAYFNNDADGHAVRNAQDLRRYVAG